MRDYHTIIFFDLDGTLYDNTGTVPEKVAEILKSLPDRGVLPAIASGRSPFEIKETLQCTGISSYVALTGGLVSIEGKILVNSEFSQQLIEDLLNQAGARNLSLAFYNIAENRVTKMDKNVIATYEHIHSPLPIIEENYYQNNVVNMMLVFSQNSEKGLQDQFAGTLNFHRNIPYAMDITLQNISKKSGIQAFINYFKNKNMRTFAFGDGKNDLPMSEVVDHFIAMGNAADEVKDVAEYVTSTNNQNGIIKGLRHFNLIDCDETQSWN